MEYEFLCKTFRCCIDEACCNCPLFDFEIEHCEKQIKQQAIAFIDRQQADKERLEIELQKAKAEIKELQEILGGTAKVQSQTCAVVRVKAVREFAERLKKHKQVENYEINGYPYKFEFVEINDIDNLVREMTEKEGGKG